MAISLLILPKKKSGTQRRFHFYLTSDSKACPVPKKNSTHTCLLILCIVPDCYFCDPDLASMLPMDLLRLPNKKKIQVLNSISYLRYLKMSCFYLLRISSSTLAVSLKHTLLSSDHPYTSLMIFQCFLQSCSCSH